MYFYDRNESPEKVCEAQRRAVLQTLKGKKKIPRRGLLFTLIPDGVQNGRHHDARVTLEWKPLENLIVCVWTIAEKNQSRVAMQKIYSANWMIVVHRQNVSL